MSDSALRPDSDEEWQELMRQLQGQSEAKPRPFFYARVHARLLAETNAAHTLLPTWLRRPAYAAALCVLILAVSGDGSAAPTRTGHQRSYLSQ